VLYSRRTLTAISLTLIFIMGSLAGYAQTSDDIGLPKTDNLNTPLDSVSNFDIEVTPGVIELGGTVEDTLIGKFFVYEKSGIYLLFEYTATAPWIVIPDYINPLWTPDSAFFEIDMTGLTPGYYHNTLEVRAYADNGATLVDSEYVPVSLHITEGDYYLEADPPEINVTIDHAQPTAYESINVFETSGAEIQFDKYSYAPWIVFDTSTPSPHITPESFGFFLINHDLYPGTFHDTIFIESNQALNTPLAVPVNFTITGDPIEFDVRAEPMQFSFILPPGDTAYDSINIYEYYGQEIPFYYNYDQPWLEFYNNPDTSLTTPYTLPFRVNAESLSEGFYGDTIIIYTASPDSFPFAPIQILVDMHVTETDTVVVRASPNNFVYTLDSSDGNFYDSTHVYEIHGRNVPYDGIVAGGGNWLRVVNSDTLLSTPGTLFFQILTDSLSTGIYQDSIAIFNPYDTLNYEPYYIRFFIDYIGEPRQLSTDPQEFYFTLNYGDSLIGEQLYVSEEHGDSVVFWAFNYTNWLQIDTINSQPLITPKNLPFNIRTLGLAPGNYSDTIVLDAAGSGYNPTLVPVNLTVVGDSGMIDVETTPSRFDFVIGQNSAAWDSLYVFETHGFNVRFDFINMQSWLKVEPLPEPPYYTPRYLDIVVSDSFLTPGYTYYDTILIHHVLSEQEFEWEKIPVSLTVEETSPGVVAYPPYFDLTRYPNSQASYHASLVTHTYGSTLPFMVSKRPGSSWLIPDDTTTLFYTPDSVYFTVDPGNLPTGTYVDSLIIYNPLDSPYYADLPIPVTLTILEERVIISSDPTALLWNLAPGDSLIGIDSIEIFEINGETIPFWLYNHASWLEPDTMDLSPLVTPETIPLNVRTGNLAPGIYFDSLMIFSSNADNTPHIIPAMLYVGDTAYNEIQLATIPGNFAFSLGIDDTVMSQLYVYEMSGRSVEFYCADFLGSGWIDVFNGPAYTPFVTPDSVLFSINTVDMPPGYYTDTLIVFNPVDTTFWYDEVKVPVTLIVNGGNCGDVNGDGLVNLLDIIALIQFLYKPNSPAVPLMGGDCDGNAKIDILDITYLINNLYRGGPSPNCP